MHPLDPAGLGFTGTQAGTTLPQIRTLHRVLSRLRTRYSAFHHGDCIGSDAEAHQLAVRLRYHVICHPPNVNGKRAHCRCDEYREAAPYLVRDKHIVLQTAALVATPGALVEELRSGTWATIRAARREGRPLYIVWPDGTLEAERVP